MKHHKERITLEMSVMDVMVTMSEGNPGALRVCFDLFKNGAAVDPEAWSPLAHLLDLDSMGIYGSKIWVLYKDVCGQNLVNMIALFRAYQLGQVEGVYDHHIKMASEGVPLSKPFDFPAIVATVKNRLPSFNADWKPEESAVGA